MSVLYSQVVTANYNPVFGLANVSTINANTVNTSTINAQVGSISTLNTSSIYANYAQISSGFISSISTTSITLDGNTLDTAGSGFGSELLLNGVPIATTANLSSIADWAYEPAISTVQMNNNDILNARNVFATNVTASATGSIKILNTSNIVASNDIMTATLEATGLITASGGVSTTFIKANLGTFSTLNTNQGSISSLAASTITASSGKFSTLNADQGVLSSLTASTITASTGKFSSLNVVVGVISSLTGDTVTASTGTFSSITGSFPPITSYSTLTVSTLTNASIVGSIMQVNANTSLLLQSQFHTDVIADRGTDVSDHSVINVSAKNGSGGIVNITGDAASVLGITPASQVNLTAAGNIAYSANSPIGGKVSIAANAGSASIAFPVGTILAGNGEVDITAYSYIGGTGITPGVVKLSGGTCSMYSGPVSAITGVYGYNYIYGTLGNYFAAGFPPGGIPAFAGTNYLYGTSGTSINNGLFTDNVQNYGSSNLNISAKSGNWVNISTCQALYMGNNPVIDGGGGTSAFIRNFQSIQAANGNFSQLYNLQTIDNGFIPGSGGLSDLTLTTYAAVGGTKYNLNLNSSSNINLNTGSGGVVNVNGSPLITTIPSVLTISTLNASVAVNTSTLTVSTINGAAYPAASTWVSTATSRLDMASYPIAVSSLTGVSSVNGAAYPPASGGGWVSTATNYLNMNGNAVTDFTGSLSLLVSTGGTYTSLTETPTTIDLLQAGGAGYIRRNAAGNIIDLAVGNIQTQAISTINTVNQTIFSGGLARTLVGSNIIQPIIQTGYVSSSGTSGTITINLPTRYTTQQSFMTFGNMIDSPAAQIFTSTISRGSFILGWNSGGGGNQTFNWMTMGQ